jgi:predicted nuclease with TOPRIM domain
MTEGQLKIILEGKLEEQRRHYEAFVEHTLTHQFGAVNDKIDSLSRDVARLDGRIDSLSRDVARLDGRVARIEDHLGLNGAPAKPPRPRRRAR